MVDISTEIAGLKLKNPVMTASGTFGSGKDFEDLVDIKKFGAIVAKSISLRPKKGNPPPRICETPSGMLNTIGLQNPGIDAFLKDDMPYLRKLGIPIIINIAAETIEDYAELAKRLDDVDGVSAIEVNISCPNVKDGGMAFGISPKLTGDVLLGVRRSTKLPVIAKLSPNVTDIKIIAKAAVDSGADAISAINTVLGMAIDIKTKKPKLSMIVGGLSGPAIKPIAIRMVHEISKVTNIPIIGIGGIMTAEDAIEFILAGASAVQVGTGSFIEPKTVLNVANGIEKYLKDNKHSSLKDIVGKMILPK